MQPDDVVANTYASNSMAMSIDSVLQGGGMYTGSQPVGRLSCPQGGGIVGMGTGMGMQPLNEVVQVPIPLLLDIQPVDHVNKVVPIPLLRDIQHVNQVVQVQKRSSSLSTRSRAHTLDSSTKPLSPNPAHRLRPC